MNKIKKCPKCNNDLIKVNTLIDFYYICSNYGKKCYYTNYHSKLYYKTYLSITHNAKNKLNNLFIQGNITNSDFICAFCGRQPIEKHHVNYEIWNCFIPLCKIHHGIVSSGVNLEGL